jgi:addiction module HigA family antidote
MGNRIQLNHVRAPTHPGTFFEATFLGSNGVPISLASKQLGIPEPDLIKFVNGESKCSPSIAKRISMATGSSVALWIVMQANLDIWEAESMEMNDEVLPFK